MFQKCMQTFLYSFETNATHFRLKIDIATSIEKVKYSKMQHQQTRMKKFAKV